MSTQHIIELIICLVPIIGTPILCWFDPAHLVKKENKS